MQIYDIKSPLKTTVSFVVRDSIACLCSSVIKPTALIIFLVIVLCSCADLYDADDFDLVKLGSAVVPLFNLPTNGSHIEKKWWPPEIAELNPESVTKNEQGIYIKLHSFFVEENGLFIPTPGTKIERGPHQEPYYRLLGNGIYSYHVTG